MDNATGSGRPLDSCVVTGGAGFIGTHLCEYLIRSGSRVIVLDDFSTGSRANGEYLAGLGAEVLEMDVGEKCRVPGPVDVLFHLACPASPDDFARMPARIVRTGGVGVINALDEAVRHAARMVYISSSEVYGDPTETPQRESYRGNVSTTGVRSCYDESKRFGEAATAAYVRECRLDAGIVRPFNTYGPRMRTDDGRVVPNFITQALRGADLTVYGDGRQTRSMCFVHDMVRAIVAMGRGAASGPINVGGDQEITVLELARTVLQLTVSPAGLAFGPAAPDDPRRRRPDIRLARAELGWRPEVPLTDGLTATVDWYRARDVAVGTDSRRGGMPELTTSTVAPFPFPRAGRLDVEPEYLDVQCGPAVQRVRFPHGEDAWLVTRHADVRTVLSDPRFSRAVSLQRDVPRVTVENFSGGIVAMDPPDHTRVRGVCQYAFTPRTIARLRDRAEEIAAQLLADAGTSFDVVEDYAIPYTLMMVCEMLGVPYGDHVRFRTWANAGLATTAISEDERWAATGHMWDYIAAVLAERRRDPRDDLMSAMIRSQAAGAAVSDDELVIVVMTILVAGYETTSTQLPNFVYVLLHEPALFAEIVRDPAIVPTAVEELMRFVPLEANGASPRYAVEDVDLGGVTIPAGDAVVAATIVANRDPSVFAQPHSVDLRRSPNPHLGFGAGPHYCLGAPLARLELQVALTALARTHPRLRISDVADALVWKSGAMVRGPSRLLATGGGVS